LAVVAVLASSGQAADHADSPTLATNQMADITDVYAWVNGSNLNLIMDVSPSDDGTHGFSPAVLYVFHLTSKSGPAVNAPGGPETRVICRFDASTSVECWVVSDTTTKDYVSGDPSNTAGVTSLLGRVKVFAGRRSDPFFFNQTGFTNAIANYKSLNTGAPDGALCPVGLLAGQAATIRNLLATGPDDFATANVMAIVVQVDKSLVTAAGMNVVAVWGSTHAAG